MEMEERLTAIDNHEINVRSFAKNTLGSIWKREQSEERRRKGKVVKEEKKERYKKGETVEKVKEMVRKEKRRRRRGEGTDSLTNWLND